MATSVLLACGLNEPKPSQFLFLSEQSGVDGSFLISSILGQRLKIPDTGTLFICLQHTYQHYSNASMRLGFNISTALNKGSLKVIEPMADISDNLFDSQFLAAPEDLLNTFWKYIEDGVAQFKNSSCVNVFVDDLSVLINLGASRELVARLCWRLSGLTKSTPNLGVVVKLNTADVYSQLSCYVGDMADVRIDIDRLLSGNFKEVDGKLILRSHDQVSLKQMLYKVNDRNVRIFAPGEVGIKI